MNFCYKYSGAEMRAILCLVVITIYHIRGKITDSWLAETEGIFS